MNPQPGTPRITGPDQLVEMASGYQKSRIILSAFELGVFTAIGNGMVSAEEVARTIGAQPKSTERFLNALCAIGLLEKKDDFFFNTEVSSRYLMKGSGEYLSRIGHMLNLYRTWGTLTEAVRQGKSVTAREYDETSLAHFIEAMHYRAKKTADALVSHIPLEGVGRVLDVGGGSGVYSMAFARARDGLHADVFDLPKVTELARRYIAESGLANRIGTKSGDYNRDEFGTGYDLVFMSAIVHINSPAENRALVGRAFRALNPGGRIVIQDHIMEEDRTAPARGALFSLNMLVNTDGGDTYTEREMFDWLAGAGCVEIERIATGMENDLMSGRKPR
ncbi:MAG TPA: methyltransferase [Spirochaetota bacterium]|nr:methyltransferase domain-containing protein [Spirochaetota bacterium]HOD13597.1 methyltransferase [Spirochaetota bacterium]HPG52147.1 methyltransferase [Spirochaetota bacterium]HPN10415.1 methyltransferase [Spirochaetota bacterium]